MTPNPVTVSADELLPCPFCSSTRVAIGRDRSAYSNGGWEVACKWDGCGGSAGGFNSRDEAVSAWNRRDYRARNRTSEPIDNYEMQRAFGVPLQRRTP